MQKCLIFPKNKLIFLRNEMEIENVYSLLFNLKHDKSVQNSDYILLQPHQIVPKYYLLSSPDRHIAILNYATGSGKSMSGVFFILERIYLTKMNQVLPNVNINKAIVVGEWQTVSSFQKELTRKMFNLIDKSLLKKLKDAKTQAEKDIINQHISNSINKYVNFYGYQMLFNRLFPSYIKQSMQNVDHLFELMKTDKLSVSQEYLNSLKGNIIVVDEFQRLYSKQGMNTYGFTLSFLARKAKELDLKIVYLSGTPFNSSLSELACILNISDVNAGNKIYGNELFETETVLTDQTIYKLKSSSIKTATDILSDKLINYAKAVVKQNYQQKTLKSIKVPVFGDVNNCLYLPNDQSPRFPTEIRVGNTIISESMMVYQIQAKGFQLKGLQNIDVEEDEETQKMSVYDAVLPPKTDWKKNDINKDSEGLYYGSFLDRKNIGKYSIAGEFLIDLCMFNASHNEKTIVYHYRLANFGLHQYAKILEHNGFVRRGNPIKQNSLCRFCLSTLDKHKKDCKHFEPIYFEMLSGTQNSKDRSFIVNRIYNSPNNLYGELISVLLISDVANVGVSLMATNNLVIIPRVSNISKIEQINARIIRMDSHMALPSEKRYAKLYLLGVTDTISKTSSVYKYYKLRDMNYGLISDFMSKLIPKSIGESLLKKPSSLTLTPEEKMLTSEMYFEDGSRAIKSMDTIILNSLSTNMWRLTALIDRIKSKEFSISYLDLSVFPDNFISYYILNNANIECFNFPQLTNDSEKVYVRNASIKDKDEFIQNHIFFKDIMNDYNSAVKGYIENVEKLPSKHKKRIYFIRLMDILSILNDYSLLVNWKYLWNEYLFDIHDEYYADDEINFIKNHSYKNRNKKNIAGMYYNGQIIMKDGSTKRIDYKFVKTVPHQEFNKTFEMQASTGIRIMFYSTADETEEITDKRKAVKGVDCLSSKHDQISKYYKIKRINAIDLCTTLIGYLCEEQLHKANKFIITPFEKNISL